MDVITSPAGSPLRETASAMDTAGLRRLILDKLAHSVGRAPAVATRRDWFVATALAIRDAAVDLWDPAAAGSGKRVYYLSLEFLVGRMLFDTIGNLGLTDAVRSALADFGVSLDEVAAQEPDAALGNGGLGRLAACFMESMATLGIPAMGYGIRYEHGLFRQSILDGVQQEQPEDWLVAGNPWEFVRPETAYPILFGGAVTAWPGQETVVWTPGETVLAVAYDTPVVGGVQPGGAQHANTLRLWSARATAPIDLAAFNRGDHVGAMRDRVRAEAISRVLYPGDETAAGQELRLRQEYFFVSASLQDLLRRHLLTEPIDTLADRAAMQLNDTHPALAIAELMRLLVDVHSVGWERAWAITNAAFSYTNHTLLPEALETWAVPLVERLLPRHMQIIYRLNARHMEAARSRGADDALLARVSLIDERDERRVRMGNLSFLGAHAVNGVSALHTELLRSHLFRDMDSIYPGRIQSKTNGITVRRWLHRANPGLTRLIVDTLGPGVLMQVERLADLAPFADDPAFQAAFAAQRLDRKAALARLIADRIGLTVDPAALFDVQVKRIHEYKRQFLNVVQIVAQYAAIREQPGLDWVPRVKIFAGKAAPGYVRAKKIIRLAHDVARVVNADKVVAGRLQVAFIPNYNVTLAEAIIPAADLSEQISTAGMEASGTGNMKLALNGALTIGTLDGANVEIRDQVGVDNIFIFGLNAAQVAARRTRPLDAHDMVAACPALAGALQAIRDGEFSPSEPGRYADLVRDLLNYDMFMLAEDFASYATQQAAVDATWRDPVRWWRMSVLNTAGMGWFSSDRTIRDYAANIWHVPVGEVAA